MAQTNIPAPAYTQLIPFSELSLGQSANIRNNIIQRLISQASKTLSVNPDKLVVRDIRPEGDFGYALEDWTEITGGTADQYETMTTGSMGDERWTGIYGVMADVDNFACTAIKFNVGGGDRAIWQLQCLKPDDDMVGLCPSGVIIPQNTIYTISRYVRSINSTTRLVLKGVIIEPRGLLISP